MRRIKGKIVRQKNDDSLNFSELISLMNIYLEEWNCRVEFLLKQIFVFYYGILILIILPFIAQIFDIDTHNLPIYIFPSIGIFLAFVFLFVCLGYAERIKASAETYSQIIEMLPEKYRRKAIKDFKCPFAVFIPIAMFITLIVLASMVLFSK